jgi:flagellar basal-body rod protein FlgB
MQTPKLTILTQAMRAYEMRAQALAENVAHADRPDYQRKEVAFEGMLQDYRRRLPGHRDPAAVAARTVVEQGPARLEDELMALADTQMRTQLTARALSEHFGLLRTGITGRTA